MRSHLPPLARTVHALALLGLGAAALAPAVAHATTVREVSTSGSTGTFSTIQAAIDASADGDIVLIDAGTWNECLTTPEDVGLTLLGEAGSASTTLSCDDGAARAITQGDDLAVGGLTITHTGGAGVDSGDFDFTGTDLVFRGLSAEVDGVGLASSGGRIVLSDATFENITRGRNGGAMFARDTDIVLRSVTVSKASATRGGALWMQSGELSASDLTLTDNTSSGAGGGLNLLDVSFSIVGSVFEGNGSGGSADGGGLYVTNPTVSGTSRVVGSTFSGNTAGSGAGLFLDGGTFELVNTTFEDNEAAADGGGACFGADARARLVGAVFESNDAERGGGVFSEASTFTSADSSFLENTADDGAGLYVAAGSLTAAGDVLDGNLATRHGGGAYLASPGHVLRGLDIASNDAEAGAGLYLAGLSAASGSRTDLLGTVLQTNLASEQGGGVWAGSYHSVLVDGSLFDGNTADGNGGGAYLQMPIASGLQHVVFEGNEGAAGGGLFMTSASGVASERTRLTAVDFVDNEATSGSGGGAYLGSGGYELNRLTFNDNTADAAGGGLFLTSTSSLFVNGAMFCANSAGTTGGGYHTELARGSWTYRNVVLQENASVSFGGGAYHGAANASGRSSNLQFVGVLGNEATGVAYYDGITIFTGNANYERLYIYDSVFQDNGRNGLANTSTISNFPAYYGTLFSGHDKGLDVLNASTSYFGTSNESYVLNPSLSAWTADGDCTNDNLSVGSTTSNGFYNYGVGPNVFVMSDNTYLYRDGDGDGFSFVEGDCADTDRDRYPGNTETALDGVDQDCSLGDDLDGDDDGFLAESVGGGDCDDGDATLNPLATDTAYDGVDSDCDDAEDDDADQDGFRAASRGGPDCNDDDPAIHPRAVDLPYDEIDADCSGSDHDLDGDGYDTVASGGTDCDDFYSIAFPGNDEVWYDGVDGDCAGDDDFDQDGDGDRSDQHGGGDCNDTNAGISSLREEAWYNGIDENCDGADDYDQDGDGSQAEGETEGGDDCDDTEPRVRPGLLDILDGLDNDCEGEVDDDGDRDGATDDEENEAGTNPLLADSDGDGLPDGVEWVPTADRLDPVDADGDGTIDVLDEDSDNDSVPDAQDAIDPFTGALDAQLDTDGDGTPDVRDDDDDGDGLPTSVEVLQGREAFPDDEARQLDTDGDGVPNTKDIDSDGDGLLDAVEGTGDSDGDGLPDFLDAGGLSAEFRDGLAPTVPSDLGFGCATQPTRSVPAGGWGLLAALGGLLALRRRRDR